MSAPVTIIDGEPIIGYYPKKLIPALHLNISVDLGSSVEWLADKYDRILSAAVRATKQLSEDQLGVELAWRPQSLRSMMMHILSFPELAYLSHVTGSMNQADMKAGGEKNKGITTSDGICAYGTQIQQDIRQFLEAGDMEALDLVVDAHYGGEVTVLELMNIILRHSTHHLKQVYWFLDEKMGITLVDKATAEDFEGINTPAVLI